MVSAVTNKPHFPPSQYQVINSIGVADHRLRTFAMANMQPPSFPVILGKKIRCAVEVASTTLPEPNRQPHVCMTMLATLPSPHILINLLLLRTIVWLPKNIISWRKCLFTVGALLKKNLSSERSFWGRVRLRCYFSKYTCLKCYWSNFSKLYMYALVGIESNEFLVLANCITMSNNSEQKTRVF